METVKVKRMTFSDPYAEVKLQKPMVGEKEMPNQAVMVKSDQGEFEPVASVGPGYNLVPNQLCRDLADDIVSRSDYSFEPLKTLWDGKRFVQMMISNESFTTIHQNELKVGLMFRNTYDASGALAFEMFMCNQICSNQYHNRNRFGFFALRHTPDGVGQWDIQDAVDQIGAGVGKLIEAAPRIKEMMDEPLTIDHLTEAHRRLDKLAPSLWGNILGRLAGEKKTRFGLFQAMTGAASHDVKGFNTLTVGNRIGEYFLKD